MADINPDLDAQLDTAIDEIDLDAPLDKPTAVERVLSVEEIQAMIKQLSVTEEGEPLKTAMTELKKGIKNNPAACATLLPEEIGEMVTALYRMTDRDLGAAIEKTASSKKGKKAGPKIDFSDKKIQQEILDDL